MHVFSERNHSYLRSLSPHLRRKPRFRMLAVWYIHSGIHVLDGIASYEKHCISVGKDKILSSSAGEIENIKPK